MSQGWRLRIGWWLAFGTFFVGVVSGSVWALAVGAFVTASFALTMALNFRGLGNAFPTRVAFNVYRPLDLAPSPAFICAILGLVALIFGFLFVAAMVRLT